jgi:hypothetical protein
MLLVERTFQLAGEEAPKPRQIFVTQSRVLAKKVKQYFDTLVESLAASSRSLEELCQLKATPEHLQFDEAEEDVIDVDDMFNCHGDLPSKYSELRDEHFPLFTTFNSVSHSCSFSLSRTVYDIFSQLCSMLEADIADIQVTDQTDSPTNIRLSGLNFAKTNVLEYRDFLRDYWPHFPQSVSKRLGRVCFSL